jgi:hypothetical protein
MTYTTRMKTTSFTTLCSKFPLHVTVYFFIEQIINSCFNTAPLHKPSNLRRHDLIFGCSLEMLTYFFINFVCGDSTSPLLEDRKPTVSAAQSLTTRTVFCSSSKFFNLNTAIRFALHNVTPVTLEPRENPHTNPTGSSSPCLGNFLATYF